MIGFRCSEESYTYSKMTVDRTLGMGCSISPSICHFQIGFPSLLQMNDAAF